MSAVTQDNELFDGAKFKVPYPTRDGAEVNRIVVRISGTIELDRNDPEQAEFAANLQAGQMHRSEMMWALAGRHSAFDAEGSATETLVWKIHSVER